MLHFILKHTMLCPLGLLFVLSLPAHALPPGVKRVATGTIVDGTPEAEKFQFANGLRLIVLSDHRNPLASLRIRLDAGSNRERPGITGLAHFFEHMMFRKTNGEPEGQYDRVLSGVGGSGNAATSTNYVVYMSTFPAPALDLMLELERKRFLDLELKDPYFSTEKQAVISERRLRYENDPKQRGLEKIRAIVERGSQRAWLTIGTHDDVQNMSIEAAQDFYKSFYVPENALITLGGPFSASEAVEKVYAAFGSWEGRLPKDTRVNPKDIIERDQGKVFICREAVNDQVFQVVFPSLNSDYQDFLMSHIFAQLLDDHDSGSLSRRLNNMNQATYFGFYKAYWQKDYQPLAAYFTLSRAQKFAEALQSFENEVEAVKKRNWGKEFRDRLQKEIDVDMANAAERMTTLVESYEWNEAHYGDFMRSKDYQQLVKSLSVQQLRSWIDKNIVFDKAYITGVTHLESYPACDQLGTEGTQLKTEM